MCVTSVTAIAKLPLIMVISISSMSARHVKQHKCNVSMQGSAYTARVGGSAKFISIVGLGKQEAANVEPQWGTSAYQVNFIHTQILFAKHIMAVSNYTKTDVPFCLASVRSPSQVFTESGMKAYCL